MESIRRDRSANLIVDGIEVADDGVGHESTRQRMPSPAIGGDDEVAWPVDQLDEGT